MSRRSEILEAIETRVKAIDGLDAEVLVGRLPLLGPDDPDAAVAILPGEDIPDDELPRARRLWVIEVHVLGRQRNWIDFEKILLESVMTAIEDERASPAQVRVGMSVAPGSTLGGLCTALVRGTVTPVERVEGTKAEGVTIEYSLAYPMSPGIT